MKVLRWIPICNLCNDNDHNSLKNIITNLGAKYNWEMK